jgi:hypothetical protein
LLFPDQELSHAKEFLEGYNEHLETDIYQGYNNLPGIRCCSCWAHIRPYSTGAVPKGKQYDYSQQGRESRTATGYSRLKTPFLIDQLAEEFPLDDFRLGLVLLPHSGSFFLHEHPKGCNTSCISSFTKNLMDLGICKPLDPKFYEIFLIGASLPGIRAL